MEGLIWFSGEYQENLSYDICSTWFDINSCDDSSCNTVPSTGQQTRCNLNNEAEAIGLGSSGRICDPPFEAPYRLHSTNRANDLAPWYYCPWCCNYCDMNATIGKYNLTCVEH